jgi:hypothetical protein
MCMELFTPKIEISKIGVIMEISKKLEEAYVQRMPLELKIRCSLC